MMRMSPPQQGHGSRSVSGVTSGSAGSTSCALACSGGWSQSNARHLTRFDEGFLMRVPTLQCVQAHEGPALENLPRTKARGVLVIPMGKVR